ncbi:sigma-54-dependent Fis family transcriptional regulator [Acidiphilium iwatense]|uniref:Sigma-54-dependent Fis family transcriptional regulator n=2 Tax=Acidiphilium iwatense TaxID=768198 RepID=A0ABS9DZ58_9PROT|nr:sigma-54-dependent Fis family transcriptional regulator [Acidiphilium iwatense]
MVKRSYSKPLESTNVKFLVEPYRGWRQQAPASADRDTMRAWERFLVGEPEATMPLGNFVVSSWQRSLAQGVNPASRHAPLAAIGDNLRHLRHRNTELLAAAADIFLRLNEMIADSRCMMLLTDPDGVVLETVGDNTTIAEGERIHLVGGGHWREDVIGTNGIGTALATGRPAQVHATEHFCEGIKSWTCAAAPIHEPGTGAILGVVDISGPPSTYQRSNLSLAVAAARQIETALAQRASLERVRLLETCLQRMPATGGILVIDRAGRIVYMNGHMDTPAALGQRMPGFDPHRPMEAWLDHIPESLRVDGFDPVMLDGRPIGAMLVTPDRARLPARGVPSGSEADVARSAFSHIVGVSQPVLETVKRARQLAKHRVPVLIHGETGVGKELFARAMHGEFDFNAPFVVFNCGAVSKELVGAELFGHVKGAFTGATADGRPGRFELADGGTLCLDEIGELPLDLQPILLRALEEGVIYRLGDTTPRRVSVQLVAMTNRDLRDEVAAGRFRRDLFYRINVTSIIVPPLRSRPGDIDLLVAHFNRTVAERHGVAMRLFGSDIMARLRAYHWPGNVRELRNLVEGLLLASGSPDVSVEEISLILATDFTNVTTGSVRLADVKQSAIARAIEEAQGNLSQAARQLGISRSTLHRRMKSR